MSPSPYNSLLALARQAKIWLTPAHQPYAQIPSGALPLWSEEFRDWIMVNFRSYFAPVTYNRVLRQLHQDAQAQPHRQSAPLRVAPVKSGYLIDLGGHVIHLNGKQWQIKELSELAHDDNRRIYFHRTAHSRTPPNPPQNSTTTSPHISASKPTLPTR